MGIFRIVAAALALAGCGAAEEQPAPPAELLPADAGPPPPVAPPPLAPCPPYPPGYTPPADAPTAEECERDREQRSAERKPTDAQAKFDKLGTIPFAERTPHPAREGMGGWINRLEPTRNGVCRFEERAAGSKPDGYRLSAYSGNMDLWTKGGEGLAHDHAIGFVEAGFLSAEPVVAVRRGLPDLWITPVDWSDPADIMLFIGTDRFECVRIDRD